MAATPSGPDEVAEDLAAFGAVAPESDADDGEEDETDDSFQIYPENWQAWRVFTSLNTSWRPDGLNGHTQGIDRAAIESTLRLMQIECGHHRAIFEDLMVMERAALEVLNREA